MTYGPPPGPAQPWPGQHPPPGYRPPAGPPPGHRPPAGPPPGYRPPAGPPPGYRPPAGPPPGYGPPAGPPPGQGRPQGPPPGNRSPGGSPPGYRPPAGPPPGYQGGPPPPPPAPPAPHEQQNGGEWQHAGAQHGADSTGTSSQDELLAPRSGKVGDLLEGDGSFGLRAGWRVLSIEYPADDVFVEAGLRVPDGYASVIVGALFTNKGGEPVEIVPTRGLCVIDTADGIHLAAAARVESHPGFREGVVLPEETLAGHVFYLINTDLDVRGVQWRDGADTLTWLR